LSYFFSPLRISNSRIYRIWLDKYERPVNLQAGKRITIGMKKSRFIVCCVSYFSSKIPLLTSSISLDGGDS